MWGDHERARGLEPSDTFATLLFQICGPAHISYGDPRWQEVLHGYNVWIHIDHTNLVVEQACTSLRLHASRSSNLAALVQHCTRLVLELCETLESQQNSGENSSERSTTTAQTQPASVTAFSNRIALVTQARSVAGMLTLLRILMHDAIIETNNILLFGDVLIYQNRDTGRADETAGPLLEACLQLIAATPISSLAVSPDLYDAMVSNQQLLLVLFADQLYAPATSSFRLVQQQQESASRSISSRGVFWDLLRHRKPSLMILVASQMLEWHVHRPSAPERSISLQQYHMSQTLAHSKQHVPDADGLYSVHQVVAAATLKPLDSTVNDNSNGNYNSGNASRNELAHQSNKKAILDATKGVLVLSSSIILLPFRLVSLAFHLFGHQRKDLLHAHRSNKSLAAGRMQRVKHVLWVSDAPAADLGNSLLLLWLHNDRAVQDSTGGSIRTIINKLTDNRWKDLPDLPSPASTKLSSGSFGSEHLMQSSSSLGVNNEAQQPSSTITKQPRATDVSSESGDLTINFELLFESFGRVAHTEPGALLLYTIVQACPTFSEFLAVRSDLDTIVLPLLRTLYMASSLRHYAQSDYQQHGGGNSNGGSTSVDIRKQQVLLNCPFRSQSQLYVIVILLLLFSQDASFGSDAFRRVTIAKLPWYQERKLQEIRLGSVLILVLLRLLTFNVNRLQDTFLLGNACAVLENLAPSVVDLHDYSAMRLCAVSLSSLQRFLALRKEHPDADIEDLTTPVSMHAEVSRTLLHVWHYALGPKNVGQNLYLVYALIYHQADWKAVLKNDCGEVGSTKRITQVLTKASAILQERGDNSRTANNVLKILQEHKSDLVEAVAERRRRKDEDFTFTYEEEADPEVFFVPYVWEVIVSAVTSGMLDWNQDEIRVFALLDKVQVVETNIGNGTTPATYSQDVSDVV